MIDYDLTRIKALFFDVDGVLSAETILLHPNGEPMRTVNIKDGYALQLAVKCGLHVAIITGGVSQSIVHRFKGLGVKEEDIYQKSRDKVPDFLDFCSRHGLQPEEVAFAGDDIPDIPVLRKAGLAVAPADAVPEVMDVCDYVSLRPGGKAFVRDLIEQVLKVHEDWYLDTDVFAKTF